MTAVVDHSILNEYPTELINSFAYGLSTHTQTILTIFSFGNGLQRARYKREVSGLQTVPKKSLACKLVFSLYETFFFSGHPLAR